MSSNAKEIAEAVLEALDSRRVVAADVHDKHHEFVALLMKREQSKIELLEDLKRHVARWGALSLFSGGLYAAWLMLKTKLGG